MKFFKSTLLAMFCLFGIMSSFANDVVLPSGYYPVEYIQGDDVSTILTDFCINTKDSQSIVVEFVLTSTDTTQTIFCSRGKNATTSTFTLFLVNGKFRFDYSSSNSGVLDYLPETYLKYKATLSHRKMVLEPGGTYSYGSGGAFVSSNPIMLFGSYVNGTGANNGNFSENLRLYSFTALKSSTVLRKYIPCVRLSDSKAGLFETVTKTFHTTRYPYGGFIAGAPLKRIMVASVPNQIYTGSPIEPNISVVDANTFSQIDPSLYDIELFDNTEIGTASIAVTGKEGSEYALCGITNTFAIVAAPVEQETTTYHVTAYSLDNEGDGLSWDSPMSITNAIAKSVAGDTILLKAGEYVLPNIVTFSKAVTVLGGYAGTDDVTLDPVCPLSVFTQAQTSDLQYILGVSATSGNFSMERVEVQCGRQFGMKKNNGACNFYVSGCNFVSNGFSYATIAKKSAEYWGKGLRIEGSDSSEIVISNCYFAYNCQTNNAVQKSGGPSAALYIAKNKRALVVDTKFYGNCAFLGQSQSASSYSNLYDLFPKGSAIYVPSPIHILRCDFRANVNHIRTKADYFSGGTVWFADGAHGSLIEDSIFAGNLDRVANGGTAAIMGGPIMINGAYVDQTVAIIGCTIACNFADTTAGAGGMTVKVGKANVKNCVFYGNKMRDGASNKAADIKVDESGIVNISYSVLGGEKVDRVFCAEGGAYNEGEGVIYSDPLLVTRAEDIMGRITNKKVGSYYYNAFPNTSDMYNAIYAIDLHPLSKAGYVKSGAEDVWLESDVNSPAIDAGDPMDSYSMEPMPNGNRRNAGVYGNTPQASKTLMSSTPVEFSNVEIEYPTGYSNPNLSFTLSGEEGVNLNVTITFTMEDGSSFSGSLLGCSTGSRYTYTFPDYYEFGTNITYTLSGDSPSATIIPLNSSFEVSVNLPPWWNRGGGEGVLHVWSEAPGDGSGRDWHNACRSWNELVATYAAASPKPSEIWFIDLASPVADANTLTVQSDLVMRGGFTYLSNSIDDREEGKRSILSGYNRYSGLVVVKNNSAKVTVERLEFTMSTTSAFSKSGAGDLDIRDCAFYWNGNSGSRVNGRGVYAAGTEETTLVSVSNCVFAANGMMTTGAYAFGCGGAAYFASLKRVYLDDCSFVTNGVARSTTTYPTVNHGGDMTSGAAVYFSSAPLTARNCSFVANHAVTRDNINESGGTLRFVGNCSGSVMSNCVVTGCSDRRGWQEVGNYGQPGFHGGALSVTMSASEHTLDLVNVTIAYNVADGISCPGGINIYTGTVNLKNSIVFGNYSSKNTNTGNRFGSDIDVKATGVLNAEYTLFTDDTTNCISYAEGASINLGEGVIYGDPLFVTDKASVDSKVIISGEPKYTYFDTRVANLAPLTKFNLHLRGGRGYYDEKTLERVSEYRSSVVVSPAIDAGDASSSYAQEKDCLEGWHGRRVNLGYYGNTPHATMSSFPGSVFRIR